MDDCPFCNLTGVEVIYSNKLVCAFFDRYPVNEGHCLIIPRRHVPNWFDVTPEEHASISRAIAECKRIIDKEFKPDGYNVGINVDTAGGQTIPHAHCHLIPRFNGDHVNPVGGVRAVIPDKADYTQPRDQTTQKRLITGDKNHFLPHFKAAIEEATTMDFASAFVMQSGVHLIWESLVDFVARGGKARFITGDYLNYTDPLALAKLLDLGENIDLRVYETAGKSFHPKAYIFHNSSGGITAFVGSSNLSRTALTDGVEWNYKIMAGSDETTHELVKSFDALLNHPKTIAVTPEWISKYHERRGDQPKLVPVLAQIDETYTPPEPHSIQKHALLALKQTRLDKNQAGLVVLATVTSPHRIAPL
jgi:HKD family nuclease